MIGRIGRIGLILVLGGCAQVDRWDATHEREYRVAYRDGGGEASMTVRPYRMPDGKSVKREVLP